MKNEKLKIKKLIISRKVEKLKSEKGNPLLFLPPFRGEIERGDLSTCQLFNLSTKIDVARDPWSAKCSGRITIRLFKRIVDRGQWIVPVCHSCGICPRESGEQGSRKLKIKNDR